MRFQHRLDVAYVLAEIQLAIYLCLEISLNGIQHVLCCDFDFFSLLLLRLDFYFRQWAIFDNFPVLNITFFYRVFLELIFNLVVQITKIPLLSLWLFLFFIISHQRSIYRVLFLFWGFIIEQSQLLSCAEKVT